ncbi:hypothetical protein PVAP13_9NG048446 [Panicum virgatum]|uniref:Uncharacterized protein n=1 Tax=Panicum virgatum TaxID=38727 RepID=A0A8T0MFR0_PANVG|nr:hypothetical protein PVAP13_9NG048446 [Panicum virgatum]
MCVSSFWRSGLRGSHKPSPLQTSCVVHRQPPPNRVQKKKNLPQPCVGGERQRVGTPRQLRHGLEQAAAVEGASPRLCSSRRPAFGSLTPHGHAAADGGRWGTRIP